MANGFIAPLVMSAQKTSQQNSIFTNGKWHALINDDIFYEMTLPAIGVQGGWGDGTTEGVAKAANVGFSAKINEVGFDFVGNNFQVFSRANVSGGVRYHTTPYTPGSDTYGTTTTTRLDGSGDDYNNSAFDNGQVSLITDQQGNPLLFAIGKASDTGPVGDGLNIGYDFPNRDFAQIKSGFDRNTSTNVDAFLFNDGTNDFVGVLFAGGGDFQLAYHITEATVTDYSTGWDVEVIGVPPTDSADDHICARAFDGSMFAMVKGGNGNTVYLITTTGGIDTATNSTTFVFTEVDDDATRPVIVIDETASEMYIVYNDTAGTGSVIAYKKQPLSGFSFTPSAAGTAAIDNGTDVFVDPTPPAGNVTADMGTFNIFARNTTGTDATWYQRISLPAEVLDVSPTGIASTEVFGTTDVAVADLAQDITFTGIAGAEAFGSGVLAAGPVDIQLTGIASGEALGNVVINTGPVDIAVTSIASDEAFGSITITQGVFVVSSSILSGEVVPNVIVAAGEVNISTTGISSDEGFGAVITAVGAADIALSGIASSELFGSATVSVSGLSAITVPSISSLEAFGAVTLVGKILVITTPAIRITSAPTCKRDTEINASLREAKAPKNLRSI